jgi:hypothetical protein
MTPEDVKREYADKAPYCESYQTIYKWEFHKSFDEANYKVGNFRFWFKIVENGWVRVGYEHRITVGGFGGGLPTKYHYDPLKNIKTLQQIDTLFRMMSEEYR